MSQRLVAEVFTADEVARAAGVSPREVHALIDAGKLHPIPGTSSVAAPDAVRVGRHLRAADLRRGPRQPRPSIPAVTPAITTRREVKTPEDPIPVVTPLPPPVERAPDPLPSRVLVAPIVAAAADPRDRQGVIDEGRDAAASQGSGSGIEPPRLLRDVKADYTDEARRRGVTGVVLLEIVVRRDGAVGDLSVLGGLAASFDQCAIAAVRQWRLWRRGCAPASGSPDV